ncbi:hypothetical protein MAPG_08966 [Magnaporthiopsis poae ATCC 64411]|uniref:Major facilitator superfamily (MFS) profile domain-containing protein n=1 Tax=Magnaporthiopsis poae (strain ATCC 64411 / 73-15) TaxID=644358 RepID=A0A0C4E8Q1_MAGP6|nr:hypothetical protein MAPG_08966 [Magnaporthiopsis poae ATCC 64411]
MEPQKPQCDVEQAAAALPPLLLPATTDEPPPPYSVFSRGEKRLLVCVVGVAMLFSPLTANIYFPAMTQLQTDLAASEQQINLSITTYLVLQAVAPVLFGDLADSTGRRPAFPGHGSPSTQLVRGSVSLLPGELNLKYMLAAADATTDATAPAGPSNNNPTSTATAAAQRRLPNPLRSIRVLFYRDSSLVLLISGVFYMVYYCVQASIATLFKRIYGFDEAVVGACYVAIGSGVVFGGYLNGRLLDWNYKTTAQEAGIEVDRERGDDLNKFPIERARLRSMHVLQAVHLVALVGYGWILEKEMHVGVPLVLQFILGFLQTCIVQTGNTLLVDVFQENPSAAAASGNIVRCGLSAGGIAAMGPLMAAIGPGFFFTTLALFGTICGVAGTHVLIRKGMQWRLDRYPLE